ncbi:MAG: AsmA-like C-terminal region-containing protein [Planctomycetota bacterium]
MENAAATRPRRLPRLLKILAILLGVLIALLLLAPLVLSTSWVRGKIERGLQDAMGTGVAVEQLGLSWFSGLSLGPLAIDNPAGFPQDRKAVRLESARGDVSLLSLLTGKLDVDATVEGLSVRVWQKTDGTTNLLALQPDGGGVEVRTSDDDPQTSESEIPTGVLDNLRLDLKLVDATIEIAHETEGLLESLRDVNATIHKEYGGSEIQLRIDAELDRPTGEDSGRLSVEVAADASLKKPLIADLDVLGLDLARYQPLVSALMGKDQVTALAGVVGGNARATVNLQSQEVRLQGDLAVDAPHFAGPLFAGLDVAAPRWSFEPDVEIAMAEDGAPPKIEASGLRVDLGFATLSGLAAEPAKALIGGRDALGVAFTVDLGAVLKMGGPIPAELADAAGAVDGKLALAVTPDAFDPEQLAAKFLDLFAAQIEAKVDHLSIQGHRVEGLTASLALDAGQASIQAQGTAGGGPLTLAMQVDPTDRATWPSELTLAWKDADVLAPSVELLRYAVPLLAGLDTDAALDFQSKISTELSLSGPLLAGDAEWLAWLNHWRGEGDLALANGAFTPAGALQPLLQLAGESGKIKFDDLNTHFQLAQGFVETSLMKFGKKAAEFGVTGKTGLDGSIEYAIDISSALAQHRDGRKVLEALGGNVPKATLGGTLDAPQFVMPDVGQLVQGALQGAVEKAADDLLQQGLQKGLNQLFKRKK